MKKKNLFTRMMIICGTVFSVITVNVFAQVSDTQLSAMEGENVEFVLDSGIRSKGILKKVGEKTVVLVYESGDIAEIAKERILSIKLIKKSKKTTASSSSFNPWGAGVINWFLGFGIGSYIQGDKKGGTTGLLWDLGSLTLWFVGSFRVTETVGDQVIRDELILGGVLWGVGFASYLSSRIFQCIRPHTYHRNNLSAFLDKTNFYIVPEVVTLANTSGRYGVKTGLNFNTKF